MFLRRIGLVLVLAHLQCLNQFVTGVARHDDLVYQASFGGPIRIGELFLIVTDDAGQSWMAYHTLWTGNHLNVRVVCVDRVMWLNGWPSLVTGHPVTDGAGPMFKINL